MAQKDVIQAPGDYILTGPLIVGTSGEMINVAQLLQEINIYQSIDTPYLSGSMLISDSAGVYEKLPIIGQERLIFSLTTPGADQNVDFRDYHAVIYNVERRMTTSNRQQSYLLNFTTIENVTNYRTKISKSFKGSIAAMVSEILVDSDMINTPKAVSIDPTQNMRKYVAPNLRPFQVINQLKEEAIDEKGQPHYLFYENPNGFFFRSLDSLIGEMGETSSVSKKEFKSQPPSDPRDIEDQLQTIQSFEILDSNNTFTNGRAGMFGSTLLQHDILNKSVSKYEHSYKETFTLRNSTNQNVGKYGPVYSDQKIDGKTINDYPHSRMFVHPSGSSDLHHEGSSTSPEYNYTHNNAEIWLQESNARGLEREYFTIKLEVFGDTTIMCGDIINVTVPSNRPLDAAEGADAIDPILSGRYLVTSLQHKVVPSDAMHSMVITAMKDSVIQKLPEIPFQLPVPPQIGIVDLPTFDVPKFSRPKLPSFKFPKINFGSFFKL